jgi:capsid protein
MALRWHCLCAHGFNSDMIAGLIRAGLATAERETMKAGAKPVEVLRVRVTDAGRRAIEG